MERTPDERKGIGGGIKPRQGGAPQPKGFDTPCDWPPAPRSATYSRADGVHLVALEHEQAKIARATELARHGRSLRAMSAALTREGDVSRSGPFFAVQVVHMLARVEQLAAARHRMSAATSRLSKTAIKSRLAPAYPPKNFVEDEFLVITAARR